MGCRKGFVAHVKKVNPKLQVIYCMLARENLASRELSATLPDRVEIVHFVKLLASNSRRFQELCSLCETCCCCYPTPYEGWGHGGRPWSPRTQATPQGLDQRVAKEQAVQRVRSWTVQNEMRDVLGQVSTGAAGKIIGCVNPKEIRI